MWDILFDTPVTLVLDALLSVSSGTLLLDTIVRTHSCETLLWQTLVELVANAAYTHSSGTLLWDSLA